MGEFERVMAGANGLGKGAIRESQRAEKAGGARQEHAIASYEHPIVVRLCRWLSAITLIVMIASGLEIFRAFPSFGGKNPERDFLIVPQDVTLGGWLGAHCNGISPSCGFSLALEFSTSRISWRAVTTVRSSSLIGMFAVSGRWSVTIFCSVPSRLRPAFIIRCRN